MSFLNILTRFVLLNFTDRFKGLRVHATGGEISVHVAICPQTVTTSPWSYTASYLIHNNGELCNHDYYEYYALSTFAFGYIANIARSNILLVANSPNTTVSITPTQSVMLPNIIIVSLLTYTLPQQLAGDRHF